MRNVTIALVVLNVAVYAFVALHGGPVPEDPYYAAGVLYGPAVRAGEWWRIVTGGFLHGGIAHIVLNMIALLQIGSVVEARLGSWRMLVVYAISLVGGGLAVVYFSPNDPTVGASGAIFGLFGALIAIGVRQGRRGRALISAMLPVLAINLAFTFAVPFVSKAGHLGGLASGFLAGLVFYAMRAQPVEPVVVDNATGEAAQAEYLPPPGRA